jgi:hypothetical protein
MRFNRYELLSAVIALFLLLVSIPYYCFASDTGIAGSKISNNLNPRKYEIPNEVNEWFVTDPAFGKYIKKEKRTDLYLIPEKANHLSPKIREGKLEIKYLQASANFSNCDDIISGTAENWSKEKWEFSVYLDGDVRAAFLALDAKGHRVEVYKERWQRKFEIALNGSLKILSPDDWGSRVCLIELTKLKIKGKHWWTVAFEIDSESELPLEISKKNLCLLFKNYPGPVLNLESSFSYPKWLSTLIIK